MAETTFNPFAPPESAPNVPVASMADYVPEENLSVEYQMSDDDYVDWNLYLMNASTTLRRNRIRVFLIWAMIAFAVGVFIWMSSDSTIARFVAVALAGVFAPTFLFYAWKPPVKANAKLLRRVFAEGRNKAAYAPTKLTIRSANVHTLNQYVESAASWECFERVLELPKHFCLQMSSANAIIVPRAAFASPDYYRRFVLSARAFLEAAHAKAGESAGL